MLVTKGSARGPGEVFVAGRGEEIIKGAFSEETVFKQALKWTGFHQAEAEYGAENPGGPGSRVKEEACAGAPQSRKGWWDQI